MVFNGVKFEVIEAARSAAGFAIYATSGVIEFLEGLEEDSFEKVLGLIQYVAEYGPPNNREKSKKVVDEIYELKSYQVRLAYIYGSRRRTILMIHGFLKKSDDWPKNHLKAAKRICAETLDATRKGTIRYADE
jgi:hypothetical protein